MNNADGEPEVSIAERMERLERRANVVRSRLVSAVEALDARRHQVVNIGKQAKTLAPVALGAAALVGVAALALGYFVVRRRRRLPLGERVAQALEELGAARRPSLARRMLEKAVLTTVSVGIAEVARRAARNAFDGRLLDGRLAIGGALEAHHRELGP